MARIYSHDGYVAADGLQGCEKCDEAILLARRIADEWVEPVELEDDDGSWWVYPVRADGVRPAKLAVGDDDEGPDDWAVCDRCGQHAVHHSEGCR